MRDHERFRPPTAASSWSGTICVTPTPYHLTRPDGRAEPEAIVDQRDLVERAKRGDHDAFEALAGPAVARLDAAARLILRDPELAHDAVQEGFIRAWRNLPGVARSGSLRRLAPSPRRQFLHRHHAPSAPTSDRGRTDPARCARPTATSPSVIADRELLDGALRRLDPEWRAIVVMHYFLGMPLPEVAQPLGSLSGPPSPGSTDRSGACGIDPLRTRTALQRPDPRRATA